MNKQEALNKIKELEQYIENIGNQSNIWIPKKNQEYLYVDDLGRFDNSYWDNNIADNWRLANKNVFKTEKDPQKYKTIHMAIWETAQKLNEENPIDWENKHQLKFSLCYDYSFKGVHQERFTDTKYQGAIYCTSKRFLDEVKKKVTESDLEWYLKR